MTEMTLTTTDEVVELIHLLSTRKFRFGDDLAALSGIVNDVIGECLAAHPDLRGRFETFRPDAVALFEQVTAAGEGSPTWAYLQGRSEAERLQLIGAFFLPLAPLRPVDFRTPEGIAHAYRA